MVSGWGPILQSWPENARPKANEIISLTSKDQLQPRHIGRISFHALRLQKA